MSAQADDIEGPAWIPEPDEQVREDSPFVAECLSNTKGLGWELGTSLLTYSDKWGEIWRVDFKYGNLHPLVNRIMCWKKPDGQFVLGVVVGHVLPPLPS